MIRVGIIGCGRIAQERHLPEYEANPNSTIAAVFDNSPERAVEVASRYGARTYGSVDELLADESIDAVSVCTPNSLHAEMSIRALHAGKHVLCEKPMATTLEDCEAMVAAAAAAGRQLAIGQNQRLVMAHQLARDLVGAGKIGRVITFCTTFAHGGPESWSVTPGTGSWFFDSKRASLGAMADLGVHKTDLIQFLLGQTVSSVTARVATLDKRDSAGNLVSVDDNAFCIYTMSGGAVGTMRASWTNYGVENNSTVLYGSLGTMRIFDDPDHAIVVELRDGCREVYDASAMQTNDNQTSSGVIDAFVDGIESGAPSVLDAATVLPAMRAVFAAVESAKAGGASVEGTRQ